MRALMYDRYGDETVLQLRQIGAPRPGPGQVLVQVALASLNPVDFKLRAGMFRLVRKPRLPAITGKDFAGRISAVGTGVTGYAVGQRVFGSIDPMPGTGSCAEKLVVGTDRVAPTPDGVSDEVAACLGVASGTALQALVTIADLRAHHRLLVTGASGAVGSSAVQLARAIGARIVGVCSTANVDYVRGIGADEVVDYRLADWRDRKEIYDVVFDAAGASSYGAARRNLAPAGYYINTFPKPSMFLRSPIVNALARQRSVPFMLKTDRTQLDALGRMAAQGVLKPRIARTVSLLEVAGAQRDMAAGTIHGKVVVRVSD